MSGAPVPSPSEQVLAALRRVGGRVTVEEIQFQTGLARSEVIGALVELEEQGLVVPVSWEAVRHREAA